MLLTNVMQHLCTMYTHAHAHTHTHNTRQQKWIKAACLLQRGMGVKATSHCSRIWYSTCSLGRSVMQAGVLLLLLPAVPHLQHILYPAPTSQLTQQGAVPSLAQGVNARPARG